MTNEKPLEVKVTKLSLKIADKRLELSIEEAKKLHEALDELFAQAKPEKEYIYWPVVVKEYVQTPNPLNPYRGNWITYQTTGRTGNLGTYELKWEAK